MRLSCHIDGDESVRLTPTAFTHRFERSVHHIGTGKIVVYPFGLVSVLAEHVQQIHVVTYHLHVDTIATLTEVHARDVLVLA